MRYPAYRAMIEKGEMGARVAALKGLYARCEVCPRCCGVDRLAGETGICHSGEQLRISSYGPHHGEEDPIRGRGGSGTIFLTSCSLRCVFCQNYDISQIERGREVSVDEAARMMLELQAQGCHNINWVTPTHYVPSLVEALALAADDGLRLPMVYNTSAYDSLEVIGLLDGVVDIYMPDFKFWDTEKSRRYLQAADYPSVARAVLKEMHRQVGELELDKDGVARRGLLIRHLVMPGCLEDTRRILAFIARELSPRTYVNLMAQYHPAGELEAFPELRRGVSAEELERAFEYAKEARLTRLDERRPFGLAW